MFWALCSGLFSGGQQDPGSFLPLALFTAAPAPAAATACHTLWRTLQHLVAASTPLQHLQERRAVPPERTPSAKCQKSTPGHQAPREKPPSANTPVVRCCSGEEEVRMVRYPAQHQPRSIDWNSGCHWGTHTQKRSVSFLNDSHATSPRCTRGRHRGWRRATGYGE